MQTAHSSKPEHGSFPSPEGEVRIFGPEIVLHSIYLDEHLVEMPLPLSDMPDIIGSLFADFPCEVSAEAINPEPNAFIANIYAALVEQVFDIPQR